MSNKESKYIEILPQIESLMAQESDIVANMANVSAVLKEVFGFFWVGFYVVKSSCAGYAEELVLGPFQGPLACTRIPFGRGVCGTSWKERKTLIVPDVELFPGHIACSSLSRSEIVVPLINEDDRVIAVLDIDSKELATFDEIDKKFLERVASTICKTIK